MKLRTNPKRTAKALVKPSREMGGSKRPVVVGPAPRGRPPGSTKGSVAKAVAAVFKKNKPGPKSHHLKQNLTRSKSATATTSSSPGPQSAETTEDEDKSPTREVETRSQKSKAQELDEGSKGADLDIKSEEQSEEVETEESGDEKMEEEEDSGASDSAAGAAEVSPPEKSAEATVEQEKQLVVKLDKLDVQRPKRSTAGIQQRKLSEDSSKESGSRRSARQQMKAKHDEQTGSGGTPSDKDKDKDERSFERFYAKVKETSVVSERWSFGGVLWDPTKKMKVMAASEVDVTSSGNMRLRRCVQVFEDMTVRVMIEGADMTSTFSSTGVVKNVNEVAQLIHKVATSKICSGIKNFGSTDKVYFPHCVLRGESYFAPECPIVIDYGVVGPLCPHCNRLRNMIARRNIKETNLLYSKFNRAPVKNIRSGFGKQLYSMLTDMIEASSVDAKKERKKLRRMIPANAKEYPFRGTITSVDGVMIDENSQIQLQQHPLQIQLAQQMQHQQNLQKFIQSDSSGNITISSIGGGNTIVNTSSGNQEFIRLAKPYGGQSEMMTFNVVSSSGGPRGTFKMAREGQGSGSSGSNFPTTIGGTVLTPGEMQMVEQLVLQEGHDVGNVIIQNSGDFTLAEGQEYELIGEADPNNPIQVLEVLKEQNESNNTIEIIEVDDQTLAQLTSQNLSNFIIQEPGGDFEVQEIDANDPNFRHLVKALNPSAVVYQT